MVFNQPVLGRSYFGTRLRQGRLKSLKKCAIAGARKILIKSEIYLAKWLSSTLSGKKKSHDWLAGYGKNDLWFSSVCAMSVGQVLWPQLLNWH